MAWNNGFPMTYQQYPQGYQVPMYGQQMAQAGYQGGQMQQPPMQDMIPTIHFDMKQVENEDAINKTPPAPGTTGAYMTKDEKVIVFRTMYANGEYTDKKYDERPPAPPAPVFNPAEYVRRDEVETLVSAALAAQTATRRATKAEKTEAE